MLRWVRVREVGDTKFLVDAQVDRWRFEEEDMRVLAEGGTPASAEHMLLGSRKHRFLQKLYFLLFPGNDKV